MRTFGEQEFFSAFERCGVLPGDSILVHSALFNLGLLEGSTPRTLSGDIYKLILSYIGKGGSVFFPTFFYEYARLGMPYDTKTSMPSKGLGPLVRYAVFQPGTLRSLNPIFNVSGIGPQAEFVCRGATASAFGHGSPWDRMEEANVKVIGLGAPFVDSCTCLMCVEQRAGSPHMYNKVYLTPIYEDGRPLNALVTACVRYLDFEIQHNFKKMAKRAEETGVLASTPLGMGKVVAFSVPEIYALGLKCLAVDPYFFLAKRPEFRTGEIPLK
ncbi:MAG: AAC(3) family N-acetyltransferase [Desulfovibrionaceae bacterium]